MSKFFLILFFLISFPVFSQNNWRCVEGDCINGVGVSTDADGIRYQGSFKDGVKSGKGKQIDQNGNSYYGYWENDAPNGKGVYKLTSGEQVKYVGTFRESLYHGSGILKYRNGDIYNGEFRKDKRSGHGTLYSKSERKLYVGKWKNDQLNGTIIIFTLTSGKYEKYKQGTLVSK